MNPGELTEVRKVIYLFRARRQFGLTSWEEWKNTLVFMGSDAWDLFKMLKKSKRGERMCGWPSIDFFKLWELQNIGNS